MTFDTLSRLICTFTFAAFLMQCFNLQAGQQETLVEWSGLTMGSINYKVIVSTTSELDADKAQKQVASILANINANLSTYIPSSEVSRFNQSTSLDWFPVSPDTAKVVQWSLNLSRDTDGAFDITVKPLVELWNFGAGRSEFRIPSEDEIDRLRKHVGWKQLEVQLQPPALKKSNPNLQIDLSAIGEGYAVDTLSNLLKELGFLNHFVEIGGEIRASGWKSKGVKWRIAIERPQDQGREIDRVLDISDVAVATSGDYRNFAIVNGKRYPHQINPATGWPIDNQLASVSIVAPDCMTADALATAVMVLGEEKGAALCAKYSAEFLIVKRQGNSFREFVSSGLNQLVTVKKSSESNPIVPVFVGALILFALAMAGLLVGVVFAKRPLRGSCGGLSAITGNKDGNCGLCGGTVSNCPEPTKNSVERAEQPD